MSKKMWREREKEKDAAIFFFITCPFPTEAV